jgi:phosphopantothenoylcysteine decarboxylase/phosphopantothenate--cysteine ligase
MYEAALRLAAQSQIIIAAAAVSDWRPQRFYEQKQKKSGRRMQIALERTPDILLALGRRKRDTFLVGFAAETHNFVKHARQKLRAKHLDAIAINDVSAGGGFGLRDSALMLLWGTNASLDLGSGPKSVLAARLLDAIERLRKERDAAGD